MTEQEQLRLLVKAKTFFKEEIVKPHIEKGCLRASKLSNYNINPFLLTYLSNFLTGNDSYYSLAKTLVLPRVLGSSINTSFGMRFQRLISELFAGMGSTTSGIDIEFIDAIDGRKKYCQIKSGPNTINHDDCITIKNHFQGTINLARTNNLNIGLNDLIVGVLYGKRDELSGHYLDINTKFPVIVGEEFWHRLTGSQEFYYHLIEEIGRVAQEVDGTSRLEETIKTLALELESEFPKEE